MPYRGCQHVCASMQVRKCWTWSIRGDWCSKYGTWMVFLLSYLLCNRNNHDVSHSFSDLFSEVGQDYQEPARAPGKRFPVHPAILHLKANQRQTHAQGTYRFIPEEGRKMPLGSIIGHHNILFIWKTQWELFSCRSALVSILSQEMSHDGSLIEHLFVASALKLLALYQTRAYWDKCIAWLLGVPNQPGSGELYTLVHPSKEKYERSKASRDVSESQFMRVELSWTWFHKIQTTQNLSRLMSHVMPASFPEGL